MKKKKNIELIREIEQYLKKNYLILEEIKEKTSTLLETEKRSKLEEAGQIVTVNEYEKLLLNNITSRISILEEETEKYKRK